jgi:hypothetical protein
MGRITGRKRGILGIVSAAVAADAPGSALEAQALGLTNLSVSRSCQTAMAREAYSSPRLCETVVPNLQEGSFVETWTQLQSKRPDAHVFFSNLERVSEDVLRYESLVFFDSRRDGSAIGVLRTREEVNCTEGASRTLSWENLDPRTLEPMGGATEPSDPDWKHFSPGSSGMSQIRAICKAASRN